MPKVNCPFCEKSFSKGTNLNRHLTLGRCSNCTNRGIKRAQCPYCNMEFASEPNMRLHLSRKRCPAIEGQDQHPPPSKQRNTSPDREMTQEEQERVRKVPLPQSNVCYSCGRRMHGAAPANVAQHIAQTHHPTWTKKMRSYYLEMTRTQIGGRFR